MPWLKACCHRSRASCLRQNLNQRRQILFGAACCRLIWELLEEPSRQAIVAAENFADGAGSSEELMEKHRLAASVRASSPKRALAAGAAANASSLISPGDIPYFMFQAVQVGSAASLAASAATEPGNNFSDARLAEWRKQNVIFNSFLPSSLRLPWKTWKTPTMEAIAKDAYEKDRNSFAVLLDALEEAGVDVSDHRNITFYKGNWLVDWLRGVE